MANDGQIAELLKPMLKKRLFVALRKASPAEQMLPHVAEHLRYMNRLETEGFLFASGPFVQEGVQVGDGLTILQTAGRDLAPATTSAMNSFQRYAMIAARVLVAMIFMLCALNIIGQTVAEHEMAAHGVPASLIPALIMAARALQLIGSMGLILGIYPRISAVALLLFLIPATLMAHEFWLAVGTPLYPVQLINFSKNVGMAGGLIFIIATRSQPALLPRPRHAD
jgi:putative oxidoreductase